MQKHNDPQLAQVQTREALRLFKTAIGKRAGNIIFDEKRLQARRELGRIFRNTAKQYLAEMGFKIRF